MAPVLSPDEAMAHEMNAARGVWKAPAGVLQAAPAPRFAGRDAWQPVEAPERGQHGAEILAELNEAE